ncbi:MAG: 5-formyltetrahydrofolate cyclo-ligase [Lachnospiraceae bacterium]|nr:5-formyltetrahydrofolate cyclo-ligase [Lachnospiraceae bacterium]
MTEKVLIREKMKAFRKEMDPKEKKAREKRLCDGITEILDDLQFQEVLCYYPLPLEIDLLSAYEKWLSSGKKLYFPVTSKDRISFFSPDSLDGFSEGPMHVMEPVLRDDPYLPNEKALCLVPGLAFTKEGMRLGYGKGYYDRFIFENKKIVTLGVCFEEQVFEELPCDENDAPLNFIIFS